MMGNFLFLTDVLVKVHPL